MKLFLHNQTAIRIINGLEEWQGTALEFAAFEPDYPGLPTLTHAPAVVRYQTPEQSYIEDSNGQRYPDLFNALPYCDKIAEYAQAAPAIYIHALLNKRLLLANDPDDVIQVLAELRATDNPSDPVLPVTASWPITLRNKTGEIVDNILLNFDNGTCVAAYRYVIGLPLGEYRVDEADFDLVEFGGVSYQCKLVNPVSLTITRQLETV